MSSLNDSTDPTPLFVEYRPGMRRRIAAAVDALVALLDQIDGDAEFEEDDPLEASDPAEDDGDAEPSLGAPGTFSLPDQRCWAQGAKDDREDESELLEPGGDDELSLGAATAVNQEHAWAASRGFPEDDGEPSLGWTGHGRGHPEIALRGYDDDREGEHDGREPDVDDEPSLGSGSVHIQTHWAVGSDDDRELDEAERSGCGDMDGVKEQHGFGVEYAE